MKDEALEAMRTKNPARYTYARELVLIKCALFKEIYEMTPTVSQSALALFVDGAVRDSMSPYYYEEGRRQKIRQSSSRKNGGKGKQDEAGVKEIGAPPASSLKSPELLALEKTKVEAVKQQARLNETYGDGRAPNVRITLETVPSSLWYSCPGFLDDGTDCDGEMWANILDPDGLKTPNSPHFKCQVCGHGIYPLAKENGGK